MVNRRATRAVVTTGIVVAIMAITTGCDRYSPRDSPTAPTSALSVGSVSPNTGSTLLTSEVTIRGAGFKLGALVTLGGGTTNVRVVDSTTITVTALAHDAGTVDVVVTNPGGETATLPGAFEYVNRRYAFVPSQQTVAAGDPLSVRWTAPAGGSYDWIGLFRVGGPSFEPSWWSYTAGGITGTFTLSAPAEPGQYEFRYFLDDGFVDVVRSSPVTVR